MMKPIVIELSEINEPADHCKNILKPKVAKAKRLTEKQKMMTQAYKRFCEKYVK